MRRNIRVHVMEARSLNPSDVNGWSDPFCIVKVNNKKIFRTKVVKRTLNPRWNETTTYLHKGSLDGFLLFQIYDHDSVGASDLLGEVTIRLDDPMLISGKWTCHWYRLMGEDDNPVRGYLRLRLEMKEEGDTGDFFDPRNEFRHPEDVEREQKRRNQLQDEVQAMREVPRFAALQGQRRMEQMQRNANFSQAAIDCQGIAPPPPTDQYQPLPYQSALPPQHYQWAAQPGYQGQPGYVQPPPGYQGQPQPGYEGQPQPGYQGQPQPGYQGQPQPGYQGQPQPGYQGQPQPGYQGQPQPGYEGQPQPGYQGQPQPGYQGQPQPGYQGQPQPGYQGQPQPGYQGQPAYWQPGYWQPPPGYAQPPA